MPYGIQGLAAIGAGQHLKPTVEEMAFQVLAQAWVVFGKEQ